MSLKIFDSILFIYQCTQHFDVACIIMGENKNSSLTAIDPTSTAHQEGDYLLDHAVSKHVLLAQSVRYNSIHQFPVNSSLFILVTSHKWWILFVGICCMRDRMQPFVPVVFVYIFVCLIGYLFLVYFFYFFYFFKLLLLFLNLSC